jgi:N-acetyl-alpha-D-glucosaminyl L-malate synthase BshA
MKIGIVCYPTFGGSGVVATELGLQLSKSKYEVHFITYKQPVRLEIINSSLFFHEVNVPDYPLFHYQPYELALSSKLVDTVKKYNIELLHVHYAIPHAYAAYMTKQILHSENINIPIVTTLHGTDITLVGKHPFYKPAVRFSINNSDFVTSVSEDLKKETIKLFGVKKNIKVIPNFVDFSKYLDYKQDFDREFIAGRDEKIISHVSNFRKVKRTLDVIDIFYKIQKEVKSKLIMVGDGPDRLKCMKRCKEIGIIEKVKFLGNSNQVYDILSYSDLFLLPSEMESFGLSALEAMMLKVPIISTKVGGLPEVNVEGVSGFLFDLGDIKKMSLKAIEILKDDILLKKMKEGAYNTAKKYDIKKIIPQYEEVYKLFSK